MEFSKTRICGASMKKYPKFLREKWEKKHYSFNHFCLDEAESLAIRESRVNRLEEAEIKSSDLEIFRRALRLQVRRSKGMDKKDVLKEIKETLPAGAEAATSFINKPSEFLIKEAFRISLEESGASEETVKKLLDERRLNEVFEFLSAFSITEVWQALGLTVMTIKNALLSIGDPTSFEAIKGNIVQKMVGKEFSQVNLYTAWVVIGLGVWVIYDTIILLGETFIVNPVKRVLSGIKRFFFRKVTEVPESRVRLDKRDPLQSEVPYVIFEKLEEGEEYRFREEVLTLNVDDPEENPQKMTKETPFEFKGFLSVGRSQDPPHFIRIEPLSGSFRGDDRFTDLGSLAFIENLDGSEVL